MLAGATTGCGRLGFDAVEHLGGDGGAGGDAGDGRDAGGGPDSGVAAACGSALALLVTTDADESDVGESADPPHLGTGLSLREAIELSNSNAGHDCIEFDRPMTIMIETAALPVIDDPDGVDIDGGDQIHVTGVPSGPQIPVGIDLTSGSNAVRRLRVSNFQIGIAARSSGNTVGPGDHVHGCRIGVQLAGSDGSIGGLRCHDNSEHGIQIQTGILGSEIAQTTLHNNGIDGIQAGSAVTIRHATVALNQTGITGSGDAPLVVENSIFYQNSGSGITVEDQATVDFSDFFGDSCGNCFIGASSITDDPQFVDVPDDFSLATGSPAINAGTDTGLDVNGDSAGNFNGAAPDMGALESQE